MQGGKEKMAQKMTVTGKPTTGLKLVKELMGKDPNTLKVYAFTMQEGGNSSSPKPLPAGSRIEFTVLVTEKQVKKAGIETTSFASQKYMIQGEICIDVPFTICTGDMALIASTIQVIAQKEEKKEAAVEDGQVDLPAKTPKPPAMPVPKGTQKVIARSDITIPEESTPPSPEAIQEVIACIEANGKFDQPMVLSDTNVLVGGYAQYMAAVELGIERVPVTNKLPTPSKPESSPKVQKPRDACSAGKSQSQKPERPVPPMETWGTMPLCDIVVPEGFLKTPPNPKKVQEVMAYIQTSGQFDKPIFIGKSNRLVDGYKRYVAAVELQLEQVPVVIDVKTSPL
jgi:hypothetical protein